MKTSDPLRTYRKDYREPDYWVDTIDLHFELDPEATIVKTMMRVRRREGVGEMPLVLYGEELELQRVSIDGIEVESGRLTTTPETLTISGVGEAFEIETVVKINPRANTALSGLYESSGNFCTQCEAEGFRRITYSLDRPDVMATYSTTIVADEQAYPVMLSNGNRVAEGKTEDGRHWVKWVDPFKKPSYLFALVAGDLRCHAGEFRTMSGRDVRLEIWVEPQNIDKCEHALASLEKAMRWDEEVFGREYDLDIYMIVAVNDFNMGAMENKGLNIFNSKYVLARPDTATDTDYESIEGVIGHEYFHNWTGNRVTCRDWFQLTLKEGLTVFRDQQFTADQTSPSVKRINDVKVLRLAQFAEDSGPMAHPIRPESYIEMNNFYTTTVYNKGAEVIRMYHTLLGAGGFRKGMDLYFERHDGDAVTCDDFRAAMADANGVDLTQFERWYLQAGTPTIEAAGEWKADARQYELVLRQMLPEIPGLPAPQSLHVPIRMGLIGKNGEDMPLVLEGETDGPTERVIELKQDEQTFVFTNLPEEPVPSLARGFSAPIMLSIERGREELAFLLGNDSDPFNRWDAGQTLAQNLMLELAAKSSAGQPLELDELFIEAFGKVLSADDLDGSIKSLTMTLPAERVVAQRMETIHPDALFAARTFMLKELANAHKDALFATFDANRTTGPYTHDKQSIDRRRLKNRALGYLSMLELDETTALVRKQFDEADNMTDSQCALSLLCDLECPDREAALAIFYDKWQDNPLVVDKWFTLQAGSSLPNTFDRVLDLSRHSAFRLSNPNRVRALIGVFSTANQVRFHGPDGRAYEFLADTVMALDELNPQVTARIVAAFNQWKRFDSARRALMQKQLERIVAKPGLSKDTYEVVSAALKR